MSSADHKPFLQRKQGLTILRKKEDLDFPIHLHNAVELVMMRTGHATVLYEGRRIALSEGDLFLVFPDRIHGYEGSRDSESIVFIIPVQPYLNDFRETLEKLPVDPVLHKGAWEHTNVPFLLELAVADRLKAGNKMAHGYAMLIMAKLLPLLHLRDAPLGSTNALQSVLLYLNRHYTEPLTRQKLAAAVGYNESYISHLFSDMLQTSLTEYINTLRMNDAVYLLSNTNLSISQIADELGFGTQRSFNRAFFRQTHMTPSACRGAARLADRETEH